jgi:hypothetical protein
VKFFCGCDCGSVGVIRNALQDCGVLVQQSSVWQGECSNVSLGIDIVEALAGQRTSLDEVGFNINGIWMNRLSEDVSHFGSNERSGTARSRSEVEFS